MAHRAPTHLPIMAVLRGGLPQVVAHADGRSSVTEYDCVLLEHVFGSKPDDAQKVRARARAGVVSGGDEVNGFFIDKGGKH